MRSQPLTNNRLQAGLKILREGKIQRILNGIYRVQGSHGIYTVDTIEQTCTCPDWRYRGGLCKHLYACLIFEGKITVNIEEIPEWVRETLQECREAPIARPTYEEPVI